MATDRKLFEAVAHSVKKHYGSNRTMARDVYEEIGGYPTNGSIDLFLSVIDREGQVFGDADALIVHKTRSLGDGLAAATRGLVNGYKEFLTEKNKTTQ
ncbi:MAG: hypothetical protein NTU57_01350 [Candidatus Aenigmarchaeota archaeon]|nr:hypothetical protein [Candidatus Aenigmarchaeota archaeon]